MTLQGRGSSTDCRYSAGMPPVVQGWLDKEVTSSRFSVELSWLGWLWLTSGILEA